MSSSGYLVSPSEDPSQGKLWVETWKRLDRFLPDLRKDLDLEGPKEIEKDKERLVVVQEKQTAEAVPGS
jgi:golgi-specific brefeldin A-resistance guanine nucleotide exchange factor 1